MVAGSVGGGRGGGVCLPRRRRRRQKVQQGAEDEAARVEDPLLGRPADGGLQVPPAVARRGGQPRPRQARQRSDGRLPSRDGRDQLAEAHKVQPPLGVAKVDVKRRHLLAHAQQLPEEEEARVLPRPVLVPAGGGRRDARRGARDGRHARADRLVGEAGKDGRVDDAIYHGQQPQRALDGRVPGRVDARKGCRIASSAVSIVGVSRCRDHRCAAGGRGCCRRRRRCRGTRRGTCSALSRGRLRGYVGRRGRRHRRHNELPTTRDPRRLSCSISRDATLPPPSH